VIDRDGVIAYAQIDTDYTHRSDPGELLPVLNELQTNSSGNGARHVRAGGQDRTGTDGL
jgi:hypothetical protein